jgi:hypothetical protein
VNYVEFGQIPTDGSTWSNKLSYTFSQARPDAAQCRVTFHFKIILNGQTITDSDDRIPMLVVQDVVVMPLEQDPNHRDPFWGTTNVSPPVTLVNVRHLHGGVSNELIFADASVADRVAKAITHAVELCGGSAKPEPF